MGGEETGVHRGHHQRVHRVRLFRSDAHGAHRPQARHRHPTRGIASSAASIPTFVVPGLELATELMLRALRRRGRASRDRRQGRPSRMPPFEFDLGLVKRLSGLDLDTGEIKEMLEALGFALGGKGKRSRRRRRPGVPTSPAQPTSSRRWCGIVGLDERAGDADAARRRRGAAGADRSAEAPAPRAPRCLPRADWSRPSPGRSSRPATRGCSAAARRS